MSERTVKSGGTHFIRAVLVTGAACVAASGCEVTNPGPIQDEFLAQPASQQGLVNGGVLRLAELLSYGSYTNAIVGRELFPGGQTGFMGHDPIVQAGHVLPGTFTGFWNDGVQARFITETAIARFTEVEAPSNLLYQAYLWNAFTYRTMGEWWCDAVLGPVDPDDTTPGTYEQGSAGNFNRAVASFTAALGFAASSDETHVARGGRAAAHAWLGDWSAVASDAATIPDDFVFWINYDDELQPYYNTIFEANARQPAGSYSVIYTFFDDYYTETGDPRTPWFDDLDIPYATASLDTYGQVEWKNQAKFNSRNDDQRIVSGWEMRLLEAEAQLNSGNWQAAMTLINRVRTRNISDTTGEALDPWVASSLEEAWTFLKRERYIELWLEGRRLGDERRWAATNTPGALDTPDWESTAFAPGSRTNMFTRQPRSNCLDIPESERDRNPNVPPIG
jgi:hypothetical protein